MEVPHISECRSSVDRSVRVREVDGSIPSTPTYLIWYNLHNMDKLKQPRPSIKEVLQNFKARLFDQATGYRNAALINFSSFAGTTTVALFSDHRNAGLFINMIFSGFSAIDAINKYNRQLKENEQQPN